MRGPFTELSKALFCILWPFSVLIIEQPQKHFFSFCPGSVGGSPGTALVVLIMISSIPRVRYHAVTESSFALAESEDSLLVGASMSR